MDFKPQIVSKTPFTDTSPAISHLLKFAFSLGKRENTLNESIRFLTGSKSLRKKVETCRQILKERHSSLLGYYIF